MTQLRRFEGDDFTQENDLNLLGNTGFELFNSFDKRTQSFPFFQSPEKDNANFIGFQFPLK